MNEKIQDIVSKIDLLYKNETSNLSKINQINNEIKESANLRIELEKQLLEAFELKKGDKVKVIFHEPNIHYSPEAIMYIDGLFINNDNPSRKICARLKTSPDNKTSRSAYYWSHSLYKITGELIYINSWKD